MMRESILKSAFSRFRISPKFLTILSVAIAGFATLLPVEAVALDPFAGDRPAARALPPQQVYAAVAPSAQIRNEVVIQSSAPTTVYVPAPVSQPVTYSNVVPYQAPKRAKRRVYRPKLPKEVVIYETAPVRKVRRKKRKRVAKLDRSGLRPGEVVIYDSRWSTAKKKKSKKKRVRLASLDTSYVPSSLPRVKKKKPKRVYGGRITGAFASCFPRSLRNILNRVRRRFGNLHINSGYRSRRHNRRVGGAYNSQHTKCRAADIKVYGVSKYTVARFVRGLPGRGGVGTYGCKSHVHVDVGRYTSWHKRCGRRRYARRARRLRGRTR